MKKQVFIWGLAGILAAGMLSPARGGEKADNADKPEAAAAAESNADAEPYSARVKIDENSLNSLNLDEFSNVYTLENSVDIALRQNSRARMADESVVQTKARYDQKKTSKNVHVNFNNVTTLQNRNISNNEVVLDSLSDQLTASLQVLLTTFGRLEKEIAAAYLQIGVAAWEAVSVKRDIAYQAKKCFFACLRANALAEAAEINRKYCQESLDDVNSLGGDSLLVTQAELLLEEANDQLQRSKAEIKLCNSEFSDVLEDRNINGLTDLHFVNPEEVRIDPLFDVEDLQELALKRRSEILSIDRSLKVAEELRESEKCSRNPELSLSADYIYSPGHHATSSINMYLLNLRINWEAWDGGMREKKLIELDSQIRALEACRDRAGSLVCTEAQKAWINFNAASELAETAQKRLDLAWAYRQSVREKFLGGQVDFNEVRESLRSLNEAHKDYVKAVYEKNTAFAGLEYSAGCDFPGRRLEITPELLNTAPPEVP